MSECGHDGCVGFDPATIDLCKWPGCTRRWTTEIEAEDGWSAFLCDEHFDPAALDAPDPVHGRVVAVRGTWGLDDAMAAVSVAASPRGAARKARRKAQRQSRRRNRR